MAGRSRRSSSLMALCEISPACLAGARVGVRAASLARLRPALGAGLVRRRPGSTPARGLAGPPRVKRMVQARSELGERLCLVVRRSCLPAARGQA